MRKIFEAVRSALLDGIARLDPTILTASVLMFAAGVIVGQQTVNKDIKTRYIINASEVEVIYHNRYKSLTLDECVTEYECNIAQLLDDQANGRFISTDDPSFFYPDSVPVIEPVDCGPNDIECEKANKNAGKPAH